MLKKGFWCVHIIIQIMFILICNMNYRLFHSIGGNVSITIIPVTSIIVIKTTIILSKDKVIQRVLTF